LGWGVGGSVLGELGEGGRGGIERVCGGHIGK